jgi:hypothetical protein
VAFYFETFERVRGAKPFFGKPEGNAVKKLLAKCQGNAEQAIEVILNALESWKGNTVTILQIASDPSQFAAPAPPRKTGRTARSMQPNAEGSPFNPTDYTHHDDDEEAAAAP